MPLTCLAMWVKAQAPLGQFGIFLRPQQSGSEPDGVKRRPEPVLRMGVIGAPRRRDSSRRGAAEDNSKAWPQQVRQHMWRAACGVAHQIV